MGLTDRQYQYDILSFDTTPPINGIDLSVARGSTDDYLAHGLTKKINTLTVITLDGGSLSVKLNANTNDSITLSDGFKIEGIPISELYWYNTKQADGTIAEIFAAWID